jgi:hypothetical protein
VVGTEPSHGRAYRGMFPTSTVNEDRPCAASAGKQRRDMGRGAGASARLASRCVVERGCRDGPPAAIEPDPADRGPPGGPKRPVPGMVFEQ